METAVPKLRIQVIAVMSSARLKGNTALLVREALRGAEEEGAATAEILLPKHNLNFCQGCLSCMVKGRCYMDDDFEEIKALLRAARGIILSSPTYGGAACARMKNLLDRFGLFERFTSATFGGKYVVGISTASSAGDARKTAKNLAGIVTNGAFERGYITGFLGVSSSGGGVQRDKTALLQAHALGRKLVRDIRSGRRYPLQNPVGQLMNRFILRPNYRQATVDYREGPMKAVYDNLRQRGLIMQA